MLRTAAQAAGYVRAVNEASVSFFNRRGHRLAGVLRLPDEQGPAPAVLMCQGFSGVKHLVLPEIAAGLADAGLASLRFDYSGCGESEGEPGWIDPVSRIEDSRYAFAALAAHDAVDPARLGVYGHSYGGPIAICLTARERRARAVVSVSGPGDGASMLRALRPSWDWISLQRSVEADRSEVATTGHAAEVTLEELTPFSPALTVAYDQLKAASGSSTMQSASKYRLSNVDLMMDLHPDDAARRLDGRALLLINGEDDEVAPIETVAPVYAAAPGPKKWIRLPGAGHMDLDGGPGLAEVIRSTKAWFLDHLGDPRE